MTHLWQLKKWMLLACTLTFLYSPSSLAKTEQDVKAAYLYNFIKFIQWPQDEGVETLNLCVLGKDAVNDKLKLLEARTVRNKTLHVVDMNNFAPNKASSCDILFVGESEGKFLDDIIPNLDSQNTLTISSLEDFVESGGMIGFIKLGNVIRFEINLKQANQAQLSISSKLLELAKKVVK